MKTICYGTLPETADIIAGCDDKDYKMELVGEDREIVTKAIGQGIDAHLEAVQFTQFDAGHKLGIEVTPETMPTLIRRLTEYWEAGNEAAGNLVSDILQTLRIEWM